jgi:hypothetical protein
MLHKENKILPFPCRHAEFIKKIEIDRQSGKKPPPFGGGFGYLSLFR